MSRISRWGDARGAGRSRLAPENAREARYPAADQEAGHGGPDQHLLAVTRELRAPVGQLRDLRLQVVHRVLQLLPRVLDRGADLLRRTCHQRRASSIAARVFFASSIAIWGIGGLPFLNSRLASSPRMPANRSSRMHTIA